MKKLITVFLTAMTMFALTACGGGEEIPAEPDLDPALTFEEMGEGTICLSTPSGTSENGEIPVFYLANDTKLTQLGFSTRGMDGSVLSYIYVDRYLVEKDQLANSDTSINLTDNSLATGVHTVEVIQFAGDDPAGEVLTYKSAQYEIKEK